VSPFKTRSRVVPYPELSIIGSLIPEFVQEGHASQMVEPFPARVQVQPTRQQPSRLDPRVAAKALCSIEKRFVTYRMKRRGNCSARGEVAWGRARVSSNTLKQRFGEFAYASSVSSYCPKETT